MGISRRRFLGWLAAAGAATKATLSFARSAADPHARRSGFSILQGMTDETSAQFSIVLPKNEEFRFEVGNAGTVTAIESVSRPTSDFLVHKFVADGLETGVDYSLKVYRANGDLADERTFRALDLQSSRARIALVSCAMDHLHKSDVWQQFENQAPDICFFLGDNVYADRKTLFEKVAEADPELLWNRYVETRNRVRFYFHRRLTPTLATWDDHDFGGNNIGKSYAHALASREIFHTFFAQHPRPELVSGPGIAQRLSAFGADFYLLDGRSFRDGPSVGGQILGVEQEEWLFRNLRARPTMLLNGSLFFGAYGSDLDSFEGQYSERFAQLKNQIRESGATVAFASGDVHYSEVMAIEAEQLGYPTFELVSSGIHSLTFPGIHDRYANPRRKIADSSPNFVIFAGEFSSGRISGEAICYTGLGEQFRAPVAAG